MGGAPWGRKWAATPPSKSVNNFLGIVCIIFFCLLVLFEYLSVKHRGSEEKEATALVVCLSCVYTLDSSLLAAYGMGFATLLGSTQIK